MQKTPSTRRTRLLLGKWARGESTHEAAAGAGTGAQAYGVVGERVGDGDVVQRPLSVRFAADYAGSQSHTKELIQQVAQNFQAPQQQQQNGQAQQQYTQTRIPRSASTTIGSQQARTASSNNTQAATAVTPALQHEQALNVLQTHLEDRPIKESSVMRYVPTRPKHSGAAASVTPAALSSESPQLQKSTSPMHQRNPQSPPLPPSQEHASLATPLKSVLLAAPFDVEGGSISSSTVGRSDSFGLLSRGTSLSSSRSERSVVSGMSAKSASLMHSVSWRFRSAKRDTVGRVVRSREEWRMILSRTEFKILREKHMEPPFSGKYARFTLPPHGEHGVFLCRGCGERLFSPLAVLPTTTGWTTFSEAFPNAVVVEQNLRGGLVLSEVFCVSCLGFLGLQDHDDLLINSHVLEFVIPKLPSDPRNTTNNNATSRTTATPADRASGTDGTSSSAVATRGAPATPS